MNTLTHILPTLLCTLTLAAHAAQPPLTGRQIMEKTRHINQPNDETIELEMHLITQGGRTRTRRLRIEYLKGTDGLDRMLIRFSYPRRMKGTGLLTIERKARSDDQWLYLPSLRRTRRIAADAKTERFVQSDFTYEDLQPEDLDANTYTLLRTETLDDRPCHIIRATPKSPSSYARRQIAVDAQRWLPLRTLYYDPAGKLLKTQTTADIHKHGDHYWRPDRIEMIDHIRRHTTRFVISARTIDRTIDPGHFTQRHLRSSR